MKRGDSLWTFYHLIKNFIAEKDVWRLLSSCVYDLKTNRSVYKIGESEPSETLRLDMIYETVYVFANGLMNVEVTDLLARYNAGISQSVCIELMIRLLRDFSNLVPEDTTQYENPKFTLSSLISNAIAGSLLKDGK